MNGRLRSWGYALPIVGFCIPLLALTWVSGFAPKKFERGPGFPRLMIGTGALFVAMSLGGACCLAAARGHRWSKGLMPWTWGKVFGDQNRMPAVRELDEAMSVVPLTDASARERPVEACAMAPAVPPLPYARAPRVPDGVNHQLPIWAAFRAVPRGRVQLVWGLLGGAVGVLLPMYARGGVDGRILAVVLMFVGGLAVYMAVRNYDRFRRAFTAAAEVIRIETSPRNHVGIVHARYVWDDVPCVAVVTLPLLEAQKLQPGEYLDLIIIPPDPACAIVDPALAAKIRRLGDVPAEGTADARLRRDPAILAQRARGCFIFGLGLFGCAFAFGSSGRSGVMLLLTAGGCASLIAAAVTFAGSDAPNRH